VIVPILTFNVPKLDVPKKHVPKVYVPKLSCTESDLPHPRHFGTSAELSVSHIGTGTEVSRHFCTDSAEVSRQCTDTSDPRLQTQDHRDGSEMSGQFGSGMDTSAPVPNCLHCS